MNYLACGTLITAALLLVLIARGKAAHKRLWKASEYAVRRIYASSANAPQLALYYSYGYPAFKLTFHTKSELQAATDLGLNESFKREVDTLCEKRGSRSRPFSAEQAIFFTYEGWLEEQQHV